MQDPQYRCLVKVGFDITEVPRETADRIEAEGLVELIDDGTAITGFFVPRKGIRPAMVRKRLKELTP